MTEFLKAEYDLIVEQWCRMRQALPPEDGRLFNEFIAVLSRGARVLDLGCGSGNPIGKQLVEAGFRLTGVDRSAKLLAKARSSLPDTEFIRSDIEDYSIKERYDGVVLWDALFHLPRQVHPPVLEKIYACLSPGGYLILSSGGCDKNIPPFTDQMFGVDFYYDALPPEKLVDTCKSLGFRLMEYSILNIPDGKRDKGRVGVLVKKEGGR
ncbi:MAG: class I SAM-dependent methyltransferase [Desulfobacterales bacterium]|nr:class I SAM-dependent methyltransferase [Desulfobacterales bacterium]